MRILSSSRQNFVTVIFVDVAANVSPEMGRTPSFFLAVLERSVFLGNILSLDAATTVGMVVHVRVGSGHLTLRFSRMKLVITLNSYCQICLWRSSTSLCCSFDDTISS